MNRLATYYIIVLGVLNTLCFSTENTVPDVVTKVATCATNWLKLETGTRAIGMGGAYTAVADEQSGVRGVQRSRYAAFGPVLVEADWACSEVFVQNPT